MVYGPDFMFHLALKVKVVRHACYIPSLYPEKKLFHFAARSGFRPTAVLKVEHGALVQKHASQ